MEMPLAIDLFCGLGGWTEGLLAEGYRAMPWKRAKALPPPDNSLFEACFRIQREASEAAGRHVPLVVENVCGAQKWVGRARWHYGSYYLWGDVPALMPIVRRASKRPGHDWNRFNETGEVSPHWRLNGEDSRKNQGGSWFSIAHNTTSGHGQNPDGRLKGPGGSWFGKYSSDQPGRNTSSGSTKRKFYAAQIAKIPFDLSRHIAAVYHPSRCAA